MIDIYLWAGHANPNDVVLRDPTMSGAAIQYVVDAGGIATSEAFGLPSVAVLPVPSTQSTGGRRRRVTFRPIPVPVTVSEAIIIARGIESGEAFGLPTVTVQPEWVEKVLTYNRELYDKELMDLIVMGAI